MDITRKVDKTGIQYRIDAIVGLSRKDGPALIRYNGQLSFYYIEDEPFYTGTIYSNGMIERWSDTKYYFTNLQGVLSVRNR